MRGCYIDGWTLMSAEKARVMCHDKSEKAFILIFFYVKSSCYLSAWPQAEAIGQSEVVFWL